VQETGKLPNERKMWLVLRFPAGGSGMAMDFYQGKTD